jgi:hypothetical protein
MTKKPFFYKLYFFEGKPRLERRHLHGNLGFGGMALPMEVRGRAQERREGGCEASVGGGAGECPSVARSVPGALAAASARRGRFHEVSRRRGNAILLP